MLGTGSPSSPILPGGMGSGPNPLWEAVSHHLASQLREGAAGTRPPIAQRGVLREGGREAGKEEGGREGERG